jgi:Ca-activated chloride channel family protein
MTTKPLKEGVMKSAKVLKVLIGVGVILLSCRFAGNDARAESKGSKKYKKVSSMSKVLEKADKKVGSGYVSMPYSPADSQETDPDSDKSLAPYFYVADGDPETDRLPLKSTSADVKIAGVIAQVRINQVFENDGKKPIEAVYVFPASTKAAVHAMRMKIGERTVEAKIEEREEAKQQYEAAKAEGKRTSLLEQQRPNVFTMNVANIMPGDKIKVEMDYSELLVPDDATYEFVYPTVVGPRYGGGADPVADSWISNPFLKEGEKEPYKFDIHVDIETGIGIKEISSPSHKVAINYSSKSAAEIKLDQDGGGNKDFVLRYRLAGDKIESGVLTYKHNDENFFGSMYGFPLDTAKEVMKKLLGDLRTSDYFNLVLFAGASYKMSDASVPATDANIKKALNIVGNQQGGGGTELMEGLRTAYGVKPPDDKGVARTTVVVTDGYMYPRENLNDSNLFAFGIGSSVNRALIEGMARAGMGEPFVVLKPETATGEAERFRTYIEEPVLTDIKVDLKGFSGYDMLPEEVPDLMAKRPIVLMGKFNGSASGQVKITGVTGSGNFSKTLDVAKAASGEETKPLRHLWARKWVEILDDQRCMLPGDKELKEAITSIGLQYSILTAFTSFIAIDSEVVNKGGSQATVKQPLPLPEGVSNYAVGGSAQYNAPASTASPAPYKAKKSGSWGGGWGGLAAAEKSADVDELEMKEESKKDKAVKTSATLTFDTDPTGTSIKLLKKKKIEWRIKKVLEAKAKAGAIPAGTSLQLTVTLEIGKDGSVTSVKVSGDQGLGLKKALSADLKSLNGYGGLDRITIEVVFNAS